MWFGVEYILRYLLNVKVDIFLPCSSIACCRSKVNSHRWKWRPTRRSGSKCSGAESFNLSTKTKLFHREKGIFTPCLKCNSIFNSSSGNATVITGVKLHKLWWSPFLTGDLCMCVFIISLPCRLSSVDLVEEHFFSNCTHMKSCFTIVW